MFTESTGMHVRQDNALDFLASTEDLINTAIEETVSHTMAEMTAASRRFEISYRDAAYSTALERVYENMRFSQFYST